MSTKAVLRLALLLSLIATLCLGVPAPQPARAAGTWYVATTGNDANDCATPATPCATITAAIGKASSGDTVKVAIGTYTGTGDEVVLINRDVTLAGGWDSATFGAQNGLSVVNGQLARRGIRVTEQATATIDHFTVREGSSSNFPENLWAAGIYSRGTLTLNTVDVRDNAQVGVTAITTSTGTLTVINSAIHHNGQGGIGSNETVYVVNSTISNNGGTAVSSSGAAHLRNVTISGNTNGTISGGISTNGFSTIKNSVLVGNAPNDCIGGVRSEGYNVVGACLFITSSANDIVTTDARLAPLDDYGGDVQTQALLAGSPAINAGDPNGCRDAAGNSLSVDSRGVARTGRCDIGAYEANFIIEKVVTGEFRPGGSITYTLKLNSTDPSTDLTDVALTDTLPDSIIYTPGSLQVSNGQGVVSNDTITWSGDVLGTVETQVSFGAIITENIWATSITNVAIGSWSGMSVPGTGSFTTDPARLYLPIASRNYCADFFDDFSTANNRWYTGDSGSLLAQIMGGEYRLLTKVSDFVLVSAPTCSRENYILEADVRWAQASTDSYGLLFGLKPDWSQFYFLDVNPYYRAFRIFRYDDTNGFVYVATPVFTSVIRSGTAINHLKITRSRGQIAVEINGAYVGSWYDGAITGLQNVGVTVLSYDDDPIADARFDNFRAVSLKTDGTSADAAAPDTVDAARQPLPDDVDWPLPKIDSTFFIRQP